MTDARLLRSLAVEDRSLDAALALGPALLERARLDRAPWIAASVSSGPAVVLGAAQRAGRVVDLDACARASTRVVRRATTGTAAYLGGTSLLWTLALPHVASLFPDASARTLVNRNVRGFLRGFRSAGLVAHYFGREWIAASHRPAALLGFDVAQSGEVLIEVVAGFDAPLQIPDSLAAAEERAVDRWQAKQPAALASLARPGASPHDFARRVVESVALQSGVELAAAGVNPHVSTANLPVVEGPLDPIPAGLVPAPPVRIPVGWLDAAASPSAAGSARAAWLGGDVLAPLWALSAIARGELTARPPELALEGATFEDLLRAAQGALAD